MIFGKQDTHVPRDGRDLIRKTLDDANVICSVGVQTDKRLLLLTVISSSRFKPSMHSLGMKVVRVVGMLR
jgi:hypothetical protein